MTLSETDRTTLNAAMSAHQGGRLEEAENGYRAVLDSTPENSDACHYLGLLLHETGRSDEALGFIDRAIAADPNNINAQGNRAALLASLGRVEDAVGQYRAALAKAPGDTDLALGLSKLLESQGDPETALTVLLDARGRNDGDDQLLLETARLLQESGRGAEAVALMRELVGRYAENVELRLRLGQLLQDLYRMDEAADQYRAAIGYDTTNALAHYKLGRCHAEKGEWAEAVAAYEQALVLRPEEPEILLYLSRALNELDRQDQAIEICERAYAVQPAYRGRDITLGILLQEAGRYAEAAKEFQHAVDTTADSVSIAALAQCLLASGKAENARQIAEAHLASHPGDTHVLVIQSLILEALGDRESVRRLVDFDNFLWQRKIDPPDGFETLDGFNAALAEHVLSHPSLTLSPPRNATRDGYHSGELFEEPMGPFGAYQTVLEAAVTDYMAALPKDPEHPFIAGAPSDWWLNAWAIVLDGPGHQISHAHNTAWLSGVYYVQLPDVVESGNDKEGWIEFGPPPPDFPVALDPETVFVKPEPGKLVLFPGYMFHQTVPTGVSDRRISVAFNMIPAPD